MRRAVVVIALAALGWYLLAVPLRAPSRFVAANGIDFVAVYCGVAVARSGADPYLVEPLRTCEHTVVPVRPPALAWSVVPAPLPAYTLMLLRPLASLPFPVAKAVWAGLGVVSLLIAAGCAAAITGLPAAAVGLAFTPTIGVLDWYYGEPIAPALALIGLAALCAARGRDRSAGVLATLALIEPHVGLGACAGAFIALPRSRLPVIATGALLALAAGMELPLGQNLVYVRAALPAQARAEVTANFQLSLTHALTLLGVAAKPALAAGSASYAGLLVVGVAAGCILGRRGAPAAALLIPGAATMLGGAYIHAPEIAAAVPGALLLCTLVSGLARRLAAVALALLVVPWNAGNASVMVVPLALAAVFVAVAVVRAGDRAPFTLAAGLTLALGAYIAAIPPGSAVAHPRVADPAAIHAGDLAADDWAMYVAATRWLLDEDVRRLMLKAPQWAGLALLVALVGAAAVRTARTPPALRATASADRLGPTVRP